MSKRKNFSFAEGEDVDIEIPLDTTTAFIKFDDNEETEYYADILDQPDKRVARVRAPFFGGVTGKYKMYNQNKDVIMAGELEQAPGVQTEAIIRDGRIIDDRALERTVRNADRDSETPDAVLRVARDAPEKLNPKVMDEPVAKKALADSKSRSKDEAKQNAKPKKAVSKAKADAKAVKEAESKRTAEAQKSDDAKSDSTRELEKESKKESKS